MAARETTDLLREIAQAAIDILKYVEGLDGSAFERLPETDSKTYRAVKNAVSEIGEAVKRLPQDVTSRHPRVDWRGLSGLRDVVAHQYHRLDLERLWPVVAFELSELIAVTTQELASLSRKQ